MKESLRWVSFSLLQFSMDLGFLFEQSVAFIVLMYSV